MLPRCQFYQVKRQVFVEFYIQDQQAQLEQDNEYRVQIKSKGEIYVYNFTNKLILQSYTCQKTKIEAIFDTDEKVQTILTKIKEIDQFEQYKKIDVVEDQKEKDVMDQIRDIYHKSDDKTKETMMKSWYESKGTVITKDW